MVYGRNRVFRRSFVPKHLTFTLNYLGAVYDVDIEYKTMIGTKCTLVIINRKTNDSMSLTTKEDYKTVERKLKNLVKELTTEKEKLYSGLSSIRARRIKRYERKYHPTEYKKRQFSSYRMNQPTITIS